MTDVVKRQLDKAKKSLTSSTNATGKGKPKAGGNGDYSRKKTATQRLATPEPSPLEEERKEGEIPSSEPATPQPRYYLSTAKTPEGLLMARLVGFTEEQWNALVPLLLATGFRPY